MKNINRKRLNPSQALKLAEKKHGNGKKTRKGQGQGNVRSVIHVDQKTGNAQVAYEVRLMVQTDEDVSLPVTLYDTDFNIIGEYDNLQHQHSKIHEQGTGPGGNSKIGCYNYGQDKPYRFLKVKDYRNGQCQYETEVRVRTYLAQAIHTFRPIQ